MQQNELQHYGVKGMRWGIRRASKKLASSSSTDEQKKKAISTLNKHREKATKKVGKLQKQGVKLEKAYNKAVLKTDPKIAELRVKSTKLKSKASSFFTSESKSAKLLSKAADIDAKITKLEAPANRAKVEYAKNKRMQELFNQGISEIDKSLASAGRKYING